jgi:hypothetical protein
VTIHAPATSFPRLYDGSIKIVLIGPPVSQPLGAAGRLPLRMLRAARDTGNGALCLMEEAARLVPDGAFHRLQVPPANVWFVWAGDDAALEHAEALLDWWREAGGAGGVPALWTAPAAELERRLLERALGEVADLHRRNQELQRNLSALREEWAHATRIPPEVTELLDNLRLSPPRMLFGSSPSTSELPVPALAERRSGGGSPGAVLVQRLPAWARGLVGVDLHVAQSGAGGGALLASLLAVDTGRVLADWRMPFTDLCPGWLPLRLPAASSQPDRVLELRVCCLAVDAAPPSLSLAPIGLLDEFSLRVDPASAAASVLPDPNPGMLALRVWGGLPGIAYDPAANVTVRPLPASITFALPDYVVAHVRRTHEGSAPFPWFGYLGGGKVLLHPLRARVVAACIPLRSMPGLVSVACETLIEDPRCQTSIACKLVVAAPEIAVDEAEREESVLASSGRMVIEAPLRPHLLTARLREPWHGPVHLHLFSDIPDGGPGHYGRAVFTRFRVEIDGQAAWSMPPALAGARDGVG